MRWKCGKARRGAERVRRGRKREDGRGYERTEEDWRGRKRTGEDERNERNGGTGLARGQREAERGRRRVGSCEK